MNMVLIRRVLRAGLLDFWRNAFVSLASIVVMAIALFTVGVAIFAGVIISFTLTGLQDKADVNVYFTTNAPEEQIIALKTQLEALPEVASVVYVSRDAALAEFRERHQNDQLTLQALEELGDNPLGAVLSIKAKDIAQYESIASFLNSQAAVEQGSPAIIDKINFYDERHRAALENLRSIVASAQVIGFFFLIALIFLTITISFNTLRLAIYTSRDEIHVMRLVGAGSFFIRAPFMVEGVLYGLVAGVVVLLLFYPLTWWLGNATEHFFGGVNVFDYYVSNFWLFILAILGTGIVLGAAASYLAVRRYLKV